MISVLLIRHNQGSSLRPNKAIKFAPFGRRTLVPRAVYGGRYVSWSSQ